jgi:transposase-like protein
MLSRFRNKQAAKRFFKKTLSNKHVKIPHIINVDKNPAFPPAFEELQKEGDFVLSTKLRRVKYLNNSIENDLKFIKRKSSYWPWYQSFETARFTIDGLETIHMIQKRQIRYAAKNNISAQNKLIHQLFGLHT